MNESCVKQIQSSDRDAFSKVYYEHFPGLCDFANVFVKDEEDAKELVQDVFFSIWNKRETWQPKGSIQSYLYKAVKNRALDFLKHQKVARGWSENVRNTVSLNMQSPEDDFCHSELSDIIEESINRMPEKRKVIFLLSREHGLTYKEIADTLQLSVKTVETQMGRAIKSLRKRLGAYLFD